MNHSDITIPHSPISWPRHIHLKWKLFNQLIDVALGSELQPWSLAEAACEAIWREWAL